MSDGKVFLISAGPRDPESPTLKALCCLGLADFSLRDDLVDRQILQFSSAAPHVIAVGKRGDCKSTPPAFIERRRIA